MDFTFTEEEQAWRREVHDFLEKEPLEGYPCEIDDDFYGFGAWSLAFMHRLAEKKWLGRTWPKEYGGQERPLMELFILFDEMAYYKSPAAAIWSIEAFGLPIISYGSEELQRKFLPSAIRGEVSLWEGFSEPNAGSDLLALTTSAVEDGDYYIINGQKTWNSYAHHASYGYTAARTDPDAPRHKGISLFLIDMSLPGITVRPIPDMAGGYCFAEIFFENARVPKEYLIGEKNQGFPLLLSGLEGDRFWARCAKASYIRRLLEETVYYCRKTKGDDGKLLAENPLIRHKLADAAIEVEICRLLSYRATSKLSKGETLTYEAAVLKTFADEMGQRFANAVMQIMGIYGQLERGSKLAPLKGEIERGYLSSVGTTIAGGTSEIQRNTIARFGLGLPSK